MVSRIIPVDPFDLVVFGGTGDLARRKIFPSLYRRFLDGQMPQESRVIGAARGRIAGTRLQLIGQRPRGPQPTFVEYDDEQAEFAFQPLQWLVGNLQSFAGLGLQASGSAMTIASSSVRANARRLASPVSGSVADCSARSAF